MPPCCRGSRNSRLVPLALALGAAPALAGPLDEVTRRRILDLVKHASEETRHVVTVLIRNEVMGHIVELARESATSPGQPGGACSRHSLALWSRSSMDVDGQGTRLDVSNRDVELSN